jgi:hypothetical protein
MLAQKLQSKGAESLATQPHDTAHTSGSGGSSGDEGASDGGGNVGGKKKKTTSFAEPNNTPQPAMVPRPSARPAKSGMKTPDKMRAKNSVRAIAEKRKSMQEVRNLDVFVCVCPIPITMHSGSRNWNSLKPTVPRHHMRTSESVG